MRERNNDALRPVSVTPGFIPSALGSALIACGNTRVICTAMIEEKVPPFLVEKGTGWVSAEYGMLPGSTQTRKQRDRGHVDGRTTEIQRLIGRSLRSVVDMEALGPRTIWLDCDVIEADGGTRTASITGAYVALALAVDKLLERGVLQKNPLLDQVAAVSCGIVEGEALLDLCYREDSRAEVDMNFVMTGDGRFIEIQGTGEKRPFTKQEWTTLMELAQKGIGELTALQRQTLTREKQEEK